MGEASIIILPINMSQQYLPEQRPYSIERASTKGPLHLRHTRRISQLQSKANFFEGQINPIYNENISLKEQLMELSKMVSSSTDILRNLLPNQEDPNKKLKLQLANLEEIASIIRVDWKDMEKALVQNGQTIARLQSQKTQWRNKYQSEHRDRLEQVEQLNNQNKLISARYQERIVIIQKQMASIVTQNNQQKQRMKDQFADKLIAYDLKFRQFEMFKREITGKYEQYQKCIVRLRGEIEANLLTFEENKKHLKGIYDKITADKLAELAEGYEMMLKIREEDRQNLVRQMLEKEEESKRTVAMKQMEIATLNQQNYRFKEEIGSLRDDVWKKQIQIDQQFAENQQILREAQQMTQKNALLVKKIEEQQKQFTASKVQLEEIIRKKQRQIVVINEERSNALQKMREEKQLAEDSLVQKQKRLKQVLLAIKKSQDEWEAKTNLLRQEWGQEKTKMESMVAEKAKKLQQQSQKLRISLLQKQQIKKQSQKSIKQLERQYSKEKEYQNKLWNSKLADLQQKNKDEIIKLQCRHERALSDANMSANEEMRQMTIQNNKKMADQQSRFMAEIQQIKVEGEQMQKHLRKAEAKLKVHDEQVQRIKVEHTKTMRQIEQQRRQQKEKMNEEMEKQIKDFQKSMEIKEAQFQKSLEQKEAELHSIKAQMQNEIKMLKEANAIEFIQNRYLAQISKLKEQFEDRYKQKESEKQRQRQLLEQSNRKQVQLLSSNYQKEIVQLTSQNQHKFSQLQASFHKNITSIADSLEWTGLSPSSLEQMGHEQKSECIVHKIGQIKDDLDSKDTKIAEMASSLEQINAEIQKKVKIRREQLERQKQLLQSNCNKKIDDVNSECQAKINRAEREKMQHTQILYQEFETMRQRFQGDYANLHKRYNELEILFEERPSRAEDLTKIKQLTNMQNRMDIQIQTYHKKMETANQIVKYLNLQLSNYKDAYDIFGPNQDGTGGIAGHSVAKPPQKSKESQYIVEALKTKKYDSELKNGDQIPIRKQSIQIKRWNDSPTINELNVFEQNECNQSMTLEPSEATESKQIKMSNLLSQKGVKKQRYKTEKVQKVDNQAEIIINAQHFIRLIKANKKEQLTGIQEVDSEVPSKRRSYRKRVIKRYPTMGVDHYF